ncbi:hypothetical protein GGI04_002893 [Coemansia thaxteri]|uniref:Uncharacterized protein n=1 Tax=Coemansia thaxteri TaxID=2663907 RepID=A0A9W8BKM0_9FUNG|nr:hypothetical protein GGI04_002893 [Coemansia thaxteri]KAJ2006198.1 hypothetical protein H4R26_001512 [Coemansia thaxteri]KAJ2466706.1 hypothetical protein GGI02_004287 [Coemansia sp. RSA 2322]KAJ2486635.1 hypothetical protein EV174_001008 [Coemansia sp. RSA 2320]
MPPKKYEGREEEYKGKPIRFAVVIAMGPDLDSLTFDMSADADEMVQNLPRMIHEQHGLEVEFSVDDVRHVISNTKQASLPYPNETFEINDIGNKSVLSVTPADYWLAAYTEGTMQDNGGLNGAEANDIYGAYDVSDDDATTGAKKVKAIPIEQEELSNDDEAPSYDSAKHYRGNVYSPADYYSGPDDDY